MEYMVSKKASEKILSVGSPPTGTNIEINLNEHMGVASDLRATDPAPLGAGARARGLCCIYVLTVSY